MPNDIDDKTKENESINNKNSSNDNDKNNDDYENYCYLCRRPESSAGPFITLPGNMHVCNECMQKSFDAPFRLCIGDLRSM